VTRAARAVLIAVPDTAWAPGRTIKAAIPTARALGDFLARRFARSTIAYVTPEAGPVTRAVVLDAFTRARPAAGELFVVLFFGHGLPASDEHARGAWALATEELTELDLAAQLRRLPAGVDTLVISSCCYGRGIPLAPMVCISPARAVLHAEAPRIVTEVTAAAERGATYRELDEKFQAERFAGREFHVDAQPPERMSELVLGLGS